MALPAFFERVYASTGGVLSLSRESLEEHLGGVCIGIELDAAWESTAASYIADLAVNIAARLYGQLDLRGSDAWVSSAGKLARSINPNVELSQRPTTVTVVIGNQRRDGDALYVRSDGWVARLLPEPLRQAPGPANPLAAGMAAGLAMAEVFRRVFRTRLPQQRPFEATAVSLLDFSMDAGANEALSTANVGSVAFAGLGAVGNAAVSVLSRFEKLHGEALLIDGQLIDLGNLQRYVLASASDVRASKVQLAADALQSTGIRVERMQLAFEDVADQMSLPPTIAVSVDNVPTRRAVQALLPRLAINGWTSDQGLGASWHEFGERGVCLACDYHPRGKAPSQYDLVMRALGLSRDRVFQLWFTGEGVNDDDLAIAAKRLDVDPSKLAPWTGMQLQDFFTSVVCGQVAIDLSGGRGPLEAVPLAHQSVMAGILMASEVVKRSDPLLSARAQPASMLVWDNVLQATPKRWTLVRAPTEHCICRDEVYQKRYRAKWLAL